MFDYDWMHDEEPEIKEVLVDTRGMTPRQANMLAIEAISKEHGYTVEDVLGKSRLKALVTVRRKCIVMLREKGYSTTEIGRIVGGRDHSTIVHSLQKSRAEA